MAPLGADQPLGDEMMRGAKANRPKPKSATKESRRQRLDKALEEGLQETFRHSGDNRARAGTT